MLGTSVPRFFTTNFFLLDLVSLVLNIIFFECTSILNKFSLCCKLGSINLEIFYWPKEWQCQVINIVYCFQTNQRQLLPRYFLDISDYCTLHVSAFLLKHHIRSRNLGILFEDPSMLKLYPHPPPSIFWNLMLNHIFYHKKFKPTFWWLRNKLWLWEQTKKSRHGTDPWPTP